jgi:S1-C subfamily serine protease
MTGPTNVAAIVSVDSVSDLAVLRTETTSANFLTLSRQVPELGSMVYTVGHPGGIPWFLTQGTVGTIFRLSTNRVEGVMCNITIYYGSSGGPLVNNNGEVVGVIGAMINRNSGMALAYPTENIVTIYPSLNSAQTL